MAKILTIPVPFGTVTRWRVVDVTVYDDIPRLTVNVRLMDANGFFADKLPLNIQDGMSDRASIGGPLVPLVIESSVVSTPTGYTDALAAWSAGGTTAQKRNALEAWMLQTGVAGANLTGT